MAFSGLLQGDGSVKVGTLDVPRGRSSSARIDGCGLLPCRGSAKVVQCELPRLTSV